jgi:RNA polymerase sigma-32 factor
MPFTGGPSFIDRIRREPRLSRAEEAELARRAWGGDAQAASRLIVSHLRFVLHIARRYGRHGHPIGELLQEGTVGLIEAVRRFNPERDVQLSSYAVWWIRAAMQDYVIRSRSLVRIGTTAAQKSMFFTLRQRMSQLADGDWLSEDLIGALASRFNTSVAEVTNLARRIGQPDQSLDAVPASGPASGIGVSLLDRLADDAPTPEDQVVAASETRLHREGLAAGLSILPPRERFIIGRRFFAEPKPSRAALGAELGLSKERVRQLEVRALERLREVLLAAIEPAEASYGGAAT